MIFKDRVVVITGASKGFGKALAKELLSEKATVIITSNNENELKATAEELGCGYYVADASSFDNCVSLVDYVQQKYSRIDVWINNAGIQIAPSQLEDVDVEKLHRLFSINYLGYFYGCKAVLPAMKKVGSGSIINVNSTAGLSGKPGLSAYVSSKFAIKGMSESLREEVKDTNIKVYQIFPGGMKTDIYREQVPEDIDAYMDVSYAIELVMKNLKSKNPELDQVIKRPVQ
jgi:NAD(P)-dependent dehydrogenase (short-subunit alcohol dehydrogenase family)